MGLVFGMALGLLFGIALMAGWKYAMKKRSVQRVLKATHIFTLGRIGQDDVKKLCNLNYPPWLSFPEYERVKWLNKQLERIWPDVAKASSEIIRANVEPMLEQYRPPGITSLKFDELSLGRVAPKIEGIRIQSFKKGQLTMDMKFHWGGDPSIILGIQTLVGANLPVQMKDLQFFATVRVIFKLADDIPCISAVVVALLADPAPVINYTLKVIGGSLTTIPGLTDMIKELVEGAVTDTLQWPHRIVVPLGQTPVDLSDLELKLQGQLTVKVLRANGLKNMEGFGKSDPFVSLYVRLLFKHKTKTINNNLNPVWDEEFSMDIEDQETQSLVLKVRDEDIGNDKMMGVATYPLAKLKAETIEELTLNLQPSFEMGTTKDKKDRGTITLSVLYHKYNEEEQKHAMEVEKALLEDRQKQRDAGLVGGALDTVGGAVGGAGKLVGSGVGMMGTGIMKGGKYVARSVTSPFGSRKVKPSVTENGASSSIPGTPSVASTPGTPK